MIWRRSGLVYSLRRVMSTIRSHDVSLHSSRDSHDVTMNNIKPHDHVMNIVKGIPFWDSQWPEDDQDKKKMAGSFPSTTNN